MWWIWVNGWRTAPLPLLFIGKCAGHQDMAGVQRLGAVGGRWRPMTVRLVRPNPGFGWPLVGPTWLQLWPAAPQQLCDVMPRCPGPHSHNKLPKGFFKDFLNSEIIFRNFIWKGKRLEKSSMQMLGWKNSNMHFGKSNKILEREIWDKYQIYLLVKRSHHL